MVVVVHFIKIVKPDTGNADHILIRCGGDPFQGRPDKIPENRLIRDTGTISINIETE